MQTCNVHITTDMYLCVQV